MSDLDFSFNALNASAYYFEIGRYFDMLLPGQREYSIDVPKVPGFTQLSKKFEPREISINGVLYASDSTVLLTRIQNFAGFLYYDLDKQLIFNNKNDRFYLAQFLEELSLEKKGNFVPLELKFTCNDPFGYAVTASSTTEVCTSKNHLWTITNAGQYYAFPIITITFHQSQSHIFIQNNNINDCRFDISKAFINNDVLVLDTKTMLITKNTILSFGGFGDGGTGKAEFIILRSGTNELQIGTDDSTINVSVNVWYRKTYL